MLTWQKEGETLASYAKRVEKIFDTEMKCLDICLFEEFLGGVYICKEVDTLLVIDLQHIVQELRKQPLIIQKADECVLDFVHRVDDFFTSLDSICNRCFIITVSRGFNLHNSLRNPKIYEGYSRDNFYDFIRH